MKVPGFIKEVGYKFERFRHTRKFTNALNSYPQWIDEYIQRHASPAEIRDFILKTWPIIEKMDMEVTVFYDRNDNLSIGVCPATVDIMVGGHTGKLTYIPMLSKPGQTGLRFSGINSEMYEEIRDTLEEVQSSKDKSSNE